MLIKNASVLVGDNLDLQKTNLQITNDRFTKIKSTITPKTRETVLDCEGLLVLPGFVNCHTHIGDSIAKDITLNSSVDERIHPVFGVKSKILKRSEPKHLASFMKNACSSMIRKGITTFVDFREGGLDGILLLRQAISKLPIRSIILGRIEYYQNPKQIRENTSLPKDKIRELVALLQQCDGIGVSGANENSNSVLKSYSKMSKIRAIHSSETIQSASYSKKITGKSETSRALILKPDFLVHMTHATRKDLCLAATKTRGIVICPRANAALAEGFPDIVLMNKSGCTIALGTDNVMINSPDMFREMDYLWKMTMATHKKRVNPKDILKMATTNAGKILRQDIGSITTGKLADCIFLEKHALDLEPMHSPYASIIHRASETSIRAVMVGGKIIHGKI